MKQIYFTVTNDLCYDQRMHRICASLAAAGYQVTLVGRKLPGSLPLPAQPFRQKRLPCLVNKGFLFYAEYNVRLFLFLLTQKMDALCAIDLDTILPCLFISKLKKIPRVYDAHEYFTELKEVRSRPRVKKFWTAVERFAVPKFKNGYTVSEGLALAFKQQYSRNYAVVRNLPILCRRPATEARLPLLLYQGAVNEARGFEYLIPAMKNIPYTLVVCGDGNFMQQLKKLIKENGVEEKVKLTGMLLPNELRAWAAKAMLGIGLAEKEGINQYFALPNKFLEYMHAGLPQLAMNFPEYQRINNHFSVAVLLNDLVPENIAAVINATMQDKKLLQDMQTNALQAREVYCWQNEEKKLLNFYQRLWNE